MTKKYFSSIFALLFLALPCVASIGDDYDYGLRINTYPLPPSEHTTFALDKGEPIATRNEVVKLSFMLLNRPENVFGTIFRIITDKGDNIDFMYTISRSDERYPMLVTGEQIWQIPSEIVMGRWIPVSISLNPASGDIELNYNGKALRLKDAGTKGARTLRIAFGLCNFEGYRLDDVASVDIKDIVLERKNNVIRSWKMSLHDGNICYDETRHIAASGTNPNWLIDKYITWKPVWSGSYTTETTVAYNPDGVFYVYDGGDVLTTVNPEKGEQTDIRIRGGLAPANAPGLMTYLPDSHVLMSYNLDEDKFAEFDFGSKTWKGCTSEHLKDCDYYNKTTALDHRARTMYSFGGYGHYYFKNSLIISKPFETRSRHIILDEITPRYNASSVIIDSLLYIFGGRGNLSGKQELSPRNYYDLYTVSLKDYKVSKVWEMDGRPEIGDYMPGENMFYNPEDDSFYTLANLGGGTLLRIARQQPEFEMMSLPVGDIQEPSQYTNLSLYRKSDGKKIYAVAVRSKVSLESTATIYEMDFPAIPVTLLQQGPEIPEEMRLSRISSIILVIILIICAGAMGFAASYFITRRKRLDGSDAIEAFHPEVKHYDFSRNSICFFGGFKVMDKNGNDITSLFTPTLRYLTVLLILHSDANHTGISSSKLNRILWSYKSEESANNNRNVFISKLRSILENMDGVSIVSQNKLWGLEFSDQAHCDYLEAMRIFKEGSNQNVNKLIELLLRGIMLPNQEVDWLDSFKGDLSNLAIDFLSKQFQRSDVPDDVLLRAADTIFMHDFLNQEALINKCRILCRQGKSGMAKGCYDSFCKEYKQSIGENFNLSFKEVIS